ncbi:MAG: peptidase S16 [Alphaproteobacteria bacterium]|nr:peptidase S16 [Alphaproteobacteria bacterium]
MEVGRPSRFELPEVIPVFPLAGALLLPRGRLPLNIFEPRYLAMVDHALRTTRTIGMIQPCGGSSTRPDLFPVGCVGRLTSWSETGDGRFLITLTGLARFQVENEIETNTPYRQVRACYKAFSTDLEDCGDARFDRARLAEILRCYLKQKQIEADWKSIERAPAEVLINSLAMICPFDVAEKQGLLEAPTLCERANMLMTLIEMATANSNGEAGGTLQ